jgi:catechol 2,3-dioxygenase-like lactoylglutathione lyase family enzyme
LISHVFVGVTDFQRAFQFYSSVMAELGLHLKFFDQEKQCAGWMEKGKPRPLFLIGAPFNGEHAVAGNGQMVALLALSRDVVDRVYADAIKNGGACEGAPGLRPHYHPNYYGAYFRDPDENKICVCFHDAVSS